MEIEVKFHKFGNGTSEITQSKEYYLINTDSLIELLQRSIESVETYRKSKFHIKVIEGEVKEVKEALLKADFKKELEIIVELGRIDTYNLATKEVKEKWSIKGITIQATQEGKAKSWKVKSNLLK